MDRIYGSQLSERQKLFIIAFSVNYRILGQRRLNDGALAIITNRFALSPSCIKNVLKEYDDKLVAGLLYPDLSPRSRQNCGLGSGLTDEVLGNIFDLNEMTKGTLSVRAMSYHYFIEFGEEIPQTTMQRYLNAMKVKYRSSYVKPTLTEHHKINRLEFILSLVEHRGAGIFRFICLKNWLHLDEKWFYVTKLNTRVRSFEGDARRNDGTTRHKSHIRKIMILSVIGSPHEVYLPDGTTLSFDGKIGLFPFFEYLPAERGSRNRPAGTPVMHCFNVTADRYLEIMTCPGGVIDTIKEKMFWAKEFPIICQHDGAPGHDGHGNMDALNLYGQLNGWNIIIRAQPAQSPDMNKNDLFFFNSLQCRAEELKYGIDTICMEELFARVEQAFADYDVSTLKRLHAFQHEVYRSILADEGGNQFYMPHSGIRRRGEFAGDEVLDRSVDALNYRHAREAIDEFYNR